jgi:hypothetical protein
MWDSLFLSYFIQHCFICHPSDSTVPTDAGIKPRTVATGALTVRLSIPVLRIRNFCFGSGYGSGSGRQLVLNPIRIRIRIQIRIRIPDSDTDQKLAKTSSFFTKILHRLIFKHKKSVIPQLRDLATNNLRNKLSIYEDLTHICILHVYSVPSLCQ